MKFSGWQIFENFNNKLYFVGADFIHDDQFNLKTIFRYKRRQVLMEKWNYCHGKNKKQSRFVIFLKRAQAANMLRCYGKRFPNRSFELKRVQFDLIERQRFNIEKDGLYEMKFFLLDHSFYVVVSESCKLIPCSKTNLSAQNKGRQLLLT